MRGDASAIRETPVAVERLEARCLLSAAAPQALVEAEPAAFSAHINFQPARRDLVDGYLPDSGQPLGDRGNGMEYGWVSGKGKVGGRKLKKAPDARSSGFAVLRPNRSSWEIAVPAGRYRVRVAAGDPSPRRHYRVEVEGTRALDAVASPFRRWFEATVDVTVADGRLTVTGVPGARGNRISYIHIDPAGAPDPDPPLPPEPAPTPTAANIAWSANAPRSPIFRTESQVVQVGSRVYALGGFTNGAGVLPVTRRCHVFDMATGKWKEIARLPAGAPTTHGSAASDGSRYIYLVAGQVEGGYGPGTNAAWRYDIATNRWQRFVDLPEIRYGGGLAYVDGWLHFFGGNTEDRESVTADHWAMNVNVPSAGWASRAALPLPGDHLSHAVIAGKIYAIGGEHGHHSQDPNHNAPYIQHNSLLRYDPIQDAWTRLADMPVASSHMEGSTLVINGKIVLVGGLLTGGGRNTTASIRVYDPATNQWSVLATRYPKRIMGPTAGYWNGRIYMTDGYSPDSADGQAGFWGTVSGI